jgi:hypothetical protein
MRIIRKLPFRTTVQIALAVLILFSLFHVAVLMGWIPYSVVWGNRIQSRVEMIPLESFSLALNTFLIWLLAQRIDLFKQVIPSKLFKILMWIVVVLFTVNTLGNLLSGNVIEQLVFSPVTALFAVFFVRIALEKELTV